MDGQSCAAPESVGADDVSDGALIGSQQPQQHVQCGRLQPGPSHTGVEEHRAPMQDSYAG